MLRHTPCVAVAQCGSGTSWPIRQLSLCTGASWFLPLSQLRAAAQCCMLGILSGILSACQLVRVRAASISFAQCHRARCAAGNSQRLSAALSVSQHPGTAPALLRRCCASLALWATMAGPGPLHSCALTSHSADVFAYPFREILNKAIRINSLQRMVATLSIASLQFTRVLLAMLSAYVYSSTPSQH